MKNDTLRNLIIASAVFFVIMQLSRIFIKPVSPQAKPLSEYPSLTQHADTGTETGTDTATNPNAAPPSNAMAEAKGFRVVEADSETTSHLGTAVTNGEDTKWADDPYRLRLVLSNVGASIVSATTTDHADSLGKTDRYKLLRPVERDNKQRNLSLGVEKINVDGTNVMLLDKKWQTDAVTTYERTTDAGQETGEKASFWVDLYQNDKPLLRIRRTILLPKQAKKNRRHDLWSNVEIENLSDTPHKVLLTYLGGAGVQRESSRMVDLFLDVGIRHADGPVIGKRHTHAEVSKRKGDPLQLFSSKTAKNGQLLSWAATANTYFTCTIAPRSRANDGPASYISEVDAVDTDASSATTDDVNLRFVTKIEPIDVGQKLQFPAEIYLGEKEFDGFRQVPVYKSRNYYDQISQGFGWCTFNWLAELMIWLLNHLAGILGDYGVSIIIMVLMVRMLLHPITKKGQVNMVRMQKHMQEVAPKIEEVKKKYANDKARMNQEMMKLNINPAGQLLTCLPMFIQMPIWVALYISLSNNISMRHEPFLFTWIHDLTTPDALIPFATPIIVPFLGWKITAFNLLPLLVSIMMFVQQKMQPKPAPSPTATDQQRSQQEMMQKMGPMMSVMMLLIFYKMPSGLNLYILASSIFGTVEQFYIRKHIKEQEAAGTLLKPKKAPVSNGNSKNKGKLSWVQKLQLAAEQAQKQQINKPKNKGKR